MKTTSFFKSMSRLFSLLVLLGITLLIPTQSLLAQGDKQNEDPADEELRAYRFVTDLKLYEYNMRDGEVLEDSVVVPKYGYQFYLLPGVISDDDHGDIYVIKFLKFNNMNDSTSLGRTLKRYIYGPDPSKGEGGLYRKYYALKASDLSEEKVQKTYHTWKPMLSIGTMIVPIKIRPKGTRDDANNSGYPMDFSTDFTLGTTAGIRMRWSKTKPYYINVLGGFGLTNVAADSSTTQGVLEVENAKLGAFTLSYGVLGEFNKFQIGLIVGHDFVGKAISRDGKNTWDYQGKPWFSVAIGYQFLSRLSENNDK